MGIAIGVGFGVGVEHSPSARQAGIQTVSDQTRDRRPPKCRPRKIDPDGDCRSVADLGRPASPSRVCHDGADISAIRRPVLRVAPKPNKEAGATIRMVQALAARRALTPIGSGTPAKGSLLRHE